MKIFCDIGGTFARFALYDGQQRVGDVRKYTAAMFERFEDALAHFSSEVSLESRVPLRIATAAYEDDGVWRFVNDNAWVISPKDLEADGWPIEVILNDFCAATWGLLELGEGDLDILSEGQENELLPRCLLGPGTGLGLGYLVPLKEGGHHVQRTHGGHMPLVCITDEQWLVAQTIKRLELKCAVPVYENVVSGPGLYNIYRALCLIDGFEAVAQDTQALLEMKESRERYESLRLFHEFLGLFAAQAVITGHAYGGLYLTGGVLERLREHNVFDFSAIRNALDQAFVDSVKRDLRTTPIYYVREPYLALRGLEHYDA